MKTRVRLSLACLLAAIGATPLHAAAAPSPWTVATIEGITIYSDCPLPEVNATNARINQLFFAFHHLWPVPPTPVRTRRILVFVRSPEEFEALNPELTKAQTHAWSLLESRSRPPIVLLNPANRVNTHWQHRDPATGIVATFSPLVYFRLQQICAGEYLSRLGERTPAWLRWGRQKLLLAVCLTDADAQIPALTTDPTLAGGKRGAVNALEDNIRAKRFYSLSELFSIEKPEVDHFNYYPVNANTLVFVQGGGDRAVKRRTLKLIPFDGTERPFWAVTPFGPFVDESYEFLHYCILDDPAHFRTALWHFGQAAANGALDEADFKSDFGVDYAAMQLRLWQDTGAARERFIHWDAGDNPPAITLKAASAVEIADVKRRWLAAARSGRQTNEGQNAAPEEGKP